MSALSANDPVPNDNPGLNGSRASQMSNSLTLLCPAANLTNALGIVPSGVIGLFNIVASALDPSVPLATPKKPEGIVVGPWIVANVSVSIAEIVRVGPDSDHVARCETAELRAQVPRAEPIQSRFLVVAPACE